MTENNDANADGKPPVGAPDANNSVNDDKSLLAAGGEGGDKAVVPAWGDDWREKIAGTDEKKLTNLKRFASPQAVFDAWTSAQEKISKGLPRTTLSETPTPEELAAYRKENGIPETVDDYKKIELDGYVIGDADKPILDKVLEKAYGKHIPPSQVKELTAAYFETVKEAQEAEIAHVKEARINAAAELQKEWGNDYKQNFNILDNFLKTNIGEEESALLNNARLEDGTLVGDNPQLLRKFLNLALEVNPMASVVQGSGMNGAKAMQDELDTIEQTLKTDRDAYFKNPKMQDRYRELLTARERLQKKSA